MPPRLLAAVTCTLVSLTSAAGVSKATPGSPHQHRGGAVVIAVVETGGLNVLHRDFAGPAERPGSFPRHTTIALPRTGSYDDRLAALQRGPLANLAADTLYRLSGTKIAVYSGASAVDLTAQRQHGTAVASAAVGNSQGTAPHATLVYVPDTGIASWKWLEQQSWIDVISTSYTTLAVSFPEAREICSSMRRIAAAGRLVVTAAGNGTPEGTALPPSGVPENYQVGGVDPGGRPVTADATGEKGTARLYETGDRHVVDAAGHDSLDGRFRFSGTSGAAPSTAGRAADLVHFARVLVQSKPGLQAGALVVAGQGASVPRSGPLHDGRLTAGELATLMHQVAVPSGPAGPARYFAEGYGALNDGAMAHAKQILRGSKAAPSRPDDDRAHFLVEAGRGLAFPNERCA